MVLYEIVVQVSEIFERYITIRVLEGRKDDIDPDHILTRISVTYFSFDCIICEDCTLIKLIYTRFKTTTDKIVDPSITAQS